MAVNSSLVLKFEIPADLNATVPPERRGVRRDHVKLMVLDKQTGRTSHAHFYELDRFLYKGDLLVLNSSRTLPAALKAEWIHGGMTQQDKMEIRLAQRLNDAQWQVLCVTEGVEEGDELYFSNQLYAKVSNVSGQSPFVILTFSLRGAALYNEIYALGQPIRYEYIDHAWELDYYQTVYASVPGSIEMPSAGRAFSWELLFKLQRKGIRIAYVQLHTGLSYLLDDKWHETPSDHYEEYYIPEETKSAIEETRLAGGRIIAVGTTVVRALETGSEACDRLGWTNLYIGSEFKLKKVDGLITGFHEPEASHLELLSAFTNPELLQNSYQEAIGLNYLWHEFGDMNLII